MDTLRFWEAFLDISGQPNLTSVQAASSLGLLNGRYPCGHVYIQRWMRLLLD